MNTYNDKFVTAVSKLQNVNTLNTWHDGHNVLSVFSQKHSKQSLSCCRVSGRLKLSGVQEEIIIIIVKAFCMAPHHIFAARRPLLCHVFSKEGHPRGHFIMLLPLEEQP